jgi:hypothetical protein
MIMKHFASCMNMSMPIFPPNGDYPTIFLHGWLVQCKGIQLNWAQYARDTTHQQLKRATRLAPCGRPKLSLIVTTQSTQIRLLN